jgi:hypothetical protein
VPLSSGKRINDATTTANARRNWAISFRPKQLGSPHLTFPEKEGTLAFGEAIADGTSLTVGDALARCSAIFCLSR